MTQSAASDRYRSFARALLEALGVAPLAGALALGCGGAADEDGAAWSTEAPPTECEEPGPGARACLPMEEGFCLPAGSEQARERVAAAFDLCLDATGGSCCGGTLLYELRCAEPQEEGQCCYAVTLHEQGVCPGGRPFTVAGAARTAAAVRRADWIAGEAAAARVEGLDAPTRGALAAGWARDARMEHASVASFARLALELLAVGAPPDLVRAAQRAMGEEIRHAELCFALASAYAGAPVGPGALSMDGALALGSLADLAEATAREGCVGETIAALAAAEARDAATDPAARAALSEIAADEAEHAAFAWRIVAWACRIGGGGRTSQPALVARAVLPRVIRPARPIRLFCALAPWR